MSGNTDDLFGKCLDRVLAGESIEDCLKDDPAAEAFRPLLEASRDVSVCLNHIEPDPRLKAQVMVHMHEALHNRRQHAARSSLAAWQPRWATAAAAAVIAVTIFGGTVFASKNSQPDGALYPVKLVTENARLALTLSDEGKAGYRVELAETRVGEMAYLAPIGDTARMDGVVQTLEANLGVSASTGTKSAPGTMVAPRAASAPSVAPAPSPAPAPSIAAVPPPVPVPAPKPAPAVAPTSTPAPQAAGAAPGPAPAPAPSPEARAFDARSAAPVSPLALSEQRSLAILQEALKNAPEPSKPALQQAIARILRAYEAAMQSEAAAK